MFKLNVKTNADTLFQSITYTRRFNSLILRPQSPSTRNLLQSSISLLGKQQALKKPELVSSGFLLPNYLI